MKRRILMIDDGRMLPLLVMRALMSIEGEGAGDGNGGGAETADLSTAERALEFWDSAEEEPADKGAAAEGGAAGEGQGGEEKPGEGAQQAGAQAPENQNQISDEQLQADPRFQEVNAFRDEVQPIFDKYGIPDAKEMDAQLSDSKVLYDIMSGKGTPSQLLDVMSQNAGWTKDQVNGVAQDLIGWLTNKGFLKGDEAGAQARGADGKFRDPLEEKVENINKTLEQQKQERVQAEQRERQTKVFNTFRDQVGKLLESKGLDKEDLDYFGREIRALIPQGAFDAVISRIEKGNFVDVKKYFDQVYTRESARMKRFSDKQVSSATRREKTQPRTPAGGAPPAPKAGQQKRDLKTSEGRLAAAQAEWDK